MATKAAILNYLDNKMANAGMTSARRLTLGMAWIMINKDQITPADAQARFPELFP